MKRAEVQRLRADFAFSERHACELMSIPRSSRRYASRRDDSSLRERLVALAHEKPRFGYRRLHILLRRASFHGRFRDECLNASWFWNLWDARRKIACWRNEYNQQRPHSALAYRTPEEFAQQWAKAASPSAFPNTTPPEASQGQALRAPAAALTPPRLRGQTFHQEDDADNYAAGFRIT